VAKRNARSADPGLAQLEQIKRLLMLGLIAGGVQAKDIARVLGVTKSAVSAIVPARGIGKLRKNEDE
jgi:predicted transcriptional regulator